MARSIMIAAGEASGDLHAAAVARELLIQDGSLKLFGMGAGQMRRAGVEILVDAGPLAVVGLSEVIAHYPALRRALNLLREAMAERVPDLLILVDHPDFNLRLAATAKHLGIPVLYYISPQVWAWRKGRLKTIQRCVNHMAVALPFEEPLYHEAGVAATFVGHPLLDETPKIGDAAAARALLNLPDAGPLVGLFPGSRKSEIRRLLPILRDVASEIQARLPGVEFILPVAPSLGRGPIEAVIGRGNTAITLVEGDIHRSIAACDAIATASGTVTLQIGLMHVPMAIFYRISRFSYWVAQRLVRVDHIGLPNIVAGSRIVPEFVQDDAQPARIADEIVMLIRDSQHREAQCRELRKLRGRLGHGGAAKRVAGLALGLVAANR